jgi:phytoene dehydrogenase-like protein
MPFTRSEYDAVVVGSGPNGLAAAITIARTGRSVLVLEAESEIGGGARSAELTLPGFVHDVCSTAHPMAVASPFFRNLPLAEHGLQWIHPAAPLAHPQDDGSAAIGERSVGLTSVSLGEDEDNYRDLMTPLVATWPKLESAVLTGPLALTRHPIAGARFGWMAIQPAERLAANHFRGALARAFFAGLAAHSVLPLNRVPSGAFALVLGITLHAVGWPFARGGSKNIAGALASYLRSLGGEIVTGTRVESLKQIPPARMILCDVTPRQLLQIAGAELRPQYRRDLENFRYGPGVCKIDWALSAPIPWKNESCRRAGTLHLGGTLEEIALAERVAWQGECPEKPFVLLTQPTLFDPSRAPAGKHIAWAYGRVPNDSYFDMTGRIESQVERFAPGFRDCILARHTVVASRMSDHNANLVGGDITGGAQELGQLINRPSWRRYRTPLKNLYICSSSTPPGGGVHGMCGHLAALAALADEKSADRKSKR